MKLFMLQDLTEFLHIVDNYKLLKSIKGNLDRMKRITTNLSKVKISCTQHSEISFNNSLNYSLRNKVSNPCVLPALEPDYGIVRANKPRYFQDPHVAIEQLFKMYKL